MRLDILSFLLCAACLGATTPAELPGGSSPSTTPATLYTADIATVIGVSGTVHNLALFGMDPGSSAAVNSTAFANAIAAADDGDTLYLPPGRYAIQSTNPATITKSIHLTGVRNQSWLVNEENATATAVYYAGTVGSAVTHLTQPHYPGETTLYVGSTTGLSAGQWIVVRDNLWLYAWNGQDTINEDVVKIDSVNSGAGTILINRPLSRRFLTSRDARVYAFSTAPPEVVVDGIGFDGCRLDLYYCVDSIVRNCIGYGSDYPSFAFRSSTGCLLTDCVTESPPTKTVSGTGAAFYLNNATLCQVRRHVARWCEGAVVRRGSRLCNITDCEFLGANTGLATYSGDCRFNKVSNSIFDGAHLVWGAGGHFADSYNESSDCQFIRPPSRAIGNAGTALAALTVTFDGRALSTGASQHGMDPGQAAILYGTTIPSGMTAYRRYFVVAPTYGAAAGFTNEFLLSAYPARPPVTILGDATNRFLAMGANWANGDAITIHGLTPPGGVDTNRIYWLRNASGTSYYLQTRPAQTATFDAGTDRVTLANAAGNEWLDGDTIMFTGGTVPAALAAAPTLYYLRDGSGGNTFKLATSAGGSAIDLADAGSGTTYAVVGITSAGSGPIVAEGGTPIALSGSITGVSLTTIGEGNVFDGHVIHDAPANVVYMHRVAGTVIRNLSIFGQQDATNGACMFTLNLCTDTLIENCAARNGLDATYNRLAHFSTCFNTTVSGGEYHLRNSTGQLITGGSSENTRLLNVSFPGISSRGSLLNGAARTGVTRLDGVVLSPGYVGGSDGSVQVIGDASVTSAAPGESGNVLVWATTLTAARTVALDDSNAVPGDWIEVVRRAGGAYTLTVTRKSDSGTLYTFSASGPATGFIRFAWTGSAWQQVASALD